MLKGTIGDLYARGSLPDNPSPAWLWVSFTERDWVFNTRKEPRKKGNERTYQNHANIGGLKYGGYERSSPKVPRGHDKDPH